ncbi:MAG: Fur family transcriptional regulator [Bacteroidetes bacterium]|nr:MAG: Fur family transcriptional regulator [Bacteroidota bacterium]
MARKTEAKRVILEYIRKSEKAVSPAEIHHSHKELCDRVTVYRVLDRLVNEHKIHRIVNTDGVANYAACHSCSTMHQHDHLHFSCERCKSVTCLENDRVEFSVPNNYEVKEVFFTLSGLCPDCLNKS